MDKIHQTEISGIIWTMLNVLAVAKPTTSKAQRQDKSTNVS